MYWEYLWVMCSRCLTGITRNVSGITLHLLVHAVIGKDHSDISAQLDILG
jgi:hypothetical protein